MSNRDAQFAGFAMLLIQEIDEQVGAVVEWGVEHDIDDEARIGQELASRWQTLIARRAYDLVQHAIGYSLEYVSECGHPMSGAMGARIQPSIPDMAVWPEETSK